MSDNPSQYDIAKSVYPTAKAQEVLQNQQIAAAFGQNALSMRNDIQQSQAILVNQTNPNKVVDEIILSIQGFEKQDDGALKRVSDPHMNEMGLSRIRFMLRSIMNQSTVLSHLELEDIGRLMVKLSDSLINDLTLNWKEYGVKDKVFLDPIVDSILFPIYFALKRAEGQNEKNWLGKISIENINNAPRIEQPKKDSWWNKFKL
jgi:hypothetical protein